MELEKGVHKRVTFGMVASVVSVVIIAIVIIIICINQNNNINQFRSEDVALYSWANDEKLDFEKSELILDHTKQDMPTELIVDGEKQEIDTTPFFFKDERKVIFPQEMNLIQPRINNGEQNRTPSLTILDGTSVEPVLRFADISRSLGNAFLFDGRDLYFFVNPMTLTANDETIELSEFSFVTYNFNHELYLYDYESDTARYLENIENVKASTDKYSVDLVTDTFEINNKSRLLVTNPGVLDTIK